MGLSVFFLWCVSALLLQAAVGLRSSMWRAPWALASQHLAVALQAAAWAEVVGLLLPAPWMPTVVTAVWAVSWMLLGFDAWMYSKFALRLQLQHLRFVQDLRLFDRQWLMHGVGLGVVVTAIGRSVALNLPEAISSRTAAVQWVLAAALGFVHATLTWRGVSALRTFGWSNRIFAAQVAWVLRSRSAAAESRGIPDALVARQELAEPLDPNYPLWRRTSRFVGPTHFDVALKANERPHVVLLFLESFGGEQIGALGSPLGITPCFDAWARRGILWRNLSANGTSTARAALAALYGLPPRFSHAPAQADDPPNTVGLADLFAKRGYRTAFFHNGPSHFEKKNPFFFERGFSTMFDAIALRKLVPQAGEGEWGPHDEHLLQQHADWLQARDAAGVPTFSALFTVSTHHPFDVPDHAPQIGAAVHPNAMARRFLRAMHYTDACLGEYLARLEATGLAEKTIVCVLADNGQQIDPHGLAYSGHLTAQSARIPLLLLAPGRLQRPLVVEEAGSQLDLMPTLMDIFAMQEAHHATGTSLRRVAPHRRPHRVHGHAPMFMGIQDGPWHATYNFDAGVGALFNTDRDPQEKHDVAHAYPATVAALHQEILATRAFCDRLYDQDRFAPANCRTPVPLAHLPRDARGRLPPGYPLSVQDMRCRLQELSALSAPCNERQRERRFLEMYLDAPLQAADKVLAAQLQYKLIYMREFGILTVAETQTKQRIQRLLDKQWATAQEA